MSFNDDAGLDTSQVSSGGGPGRMVIGGGAGLVILILSFVFGVNPGSLLGGGSDTSTPGDSSTIAAKCRTGADANRDVNCRIVGTVNSVQEFWGRTLPHYGTSYSPAKTVLYDGQTPTACGTASNAVGPFYCPRDQQVYID